MGEEEIPAHNRAERGPKRAEEKESSAFELLSLLTQMREYMKIMDELFREELRWRDKTLVAENKIRK